MTEFFIVTRPVMAALCFFALVYKILSAPNIRRDRATVALLAAIAAEGIAWTLTVPLVSQRLDLWLELPNLSALVTRLLGAAVFGPALLVAVITWSNPKAQAERKARLARIYGLCIGMSMVALWIVAAVDTKRDTYLVQNIQHPTVVAYLVLYELGFGAGLAALMRCCWVNRQHVDDTWLRRGLPVIAAGAGCYFLVCVTLLVSLPFRLSGYSHIRWEVPIGILVRLGVVGILAGILLPSIAAQSSRLGTWWRQLRSFRALDDLWRDLNRAFPEAILFDQRFAWRWYFSTEELHYLLSRRVIEIRDCWRALRPYLPDEPSESTDDISRLAAASARSLRAALAARASGETANETSGASDLERLEVTDLDEEIEWLARVGRAYSAVRQAD